MRIHKGKVRYSAYCIAGVFFVALILAVALRLNGIYPFGDKTLVYNDMQYQYVDFFMWFRRVLHGEESLAYSFNSGVGGSTVALFAYYLASPLNLFVYFVKESNIAQFLTILICAKLCLCFVTMYIFLWKRFENNPFYTMILSIGYALMGFNLLQCSNIMWIDGVILLPIVAIGLYRAVWKKRYTVYFCALSYSIIVNWYIGYMICLFSGIYFLTELFLCMRTLSKKEIGKQIVRFSVISVLAVLSSFILFLPQTLQMAGTGEKFDWSIFYPDFGFSYLAGFRDLFLNGDKLTLLEGNPPIYVGSFALLGIILLFVNKETEKNKKILFGSILLGGILVFDFKPFNYVFSLFKIPSSHTYRYAFLYSFLLIFVGAWGFTAVKEIKSKELWKSAGALLGFAVFLDYVQPYAQRQQFFLSCFIIALISGGILLKHREKRWTILVSMFLILGCTLIEFEKKAEMEFEDHVQSAAAYSEYNQMVRDGIKKTQENDSDIYRMDKTFTRTGGNICNIESLGFGYSAIAQYNSTNNVEVAELLRNLGVSGDTTVTPFTSVLPVDSLLGVKYVYSFYPLVGYQLIEENVIGENDLYKNEYWLPIGYQMKGTKDAEHESADVFEAQEALYKEILGENVELYTKNEISSYNTDFQQWTEWEVQVKNAGPLYVYFSQGQPNMEIYLNDNLVTKNVWYDNSIRYLGDFSKGEIVKIRVETSGSAYQEDYGIQIKTLNLDALGKAVNEIQKQTCSVKEMRKGVLKAEFTSSEEAEIMLTIPYEKGWKIKVNGEQKEYEKVNQCFIGVNVPEGKSEIEMTFTPPGKNLGILITAISILVYIFISRKWYKSDKAFRA